MADLGFVGTGLMGAPMVERLLANGHRVSIWNRSAEKMLPLQAQGAIIAGSPAEVAAQASLIGMCMTDASAAEAVLLGSDGICAGSHSPTVIDFTSMAPDQAVSIAAELSRQCGGSYVDAPMSGGVEGARLGELIIMCGGEATAVAQVEPILSAIARRVTHLGPSGAGQIAKLCNQHIVSASVIAMAEAFALAQSYGANLPSIPEALEGGFADSRAFQLWGKRMASGNWEPNVGAVDTMWKDVRNIRRTMELAGLALPLAIGLERIYADISAAGRGSDDLGSLVAHFHKSSTGVRS